MKALLIDGLNLIRRIYAAVPGDQGTAAHLDGALSSSASSLTRALHEHRPTHVVAVFEAQGENWRHELFADYKSKRPPMPAPLQAALPRFEAAFLEHGVQSVSAPGYEADDVLATLALKIADHDGNVVILSTDHIICQLDSDRIRIYDHFGERFLDRQHIERRYDVLPAQLPALHALAGDSALSITGIKSVGLHTAAKLIHDHGSLEKIFEAAEEMPGKLGSKLRGGREDAMLARQLFTLNTDVHLGINLNELRYPPADPGGQTDSRGA
ncbi:MAG: 5'-3' exonuclease H3TH domain-containing protein [Pseudomonadota bacterium]|nr:5'-3' exonuclease H3TH domain-containing protein [Pseudomonadota bacterium]